jgi:2',3'-cyclic-nucleotide 2'-phosphodiesterase (5'-nucleotidase family)
MRLSGLPWVLSNLSQKSTGAPLCGAAESVLLQAGPWRVGVIGLVEGSWVETLATVKASALEWEEPLHAVTRLAPRLRAEGAHVVIALTHMRLVNDLALQEGLAAAERAAPPGSARLVDAMLGGHDHDLAHLVDPTGALVPLLKSGSDFRFVSRLVVTPPGAPVAAAAAQLPGLPAAPVAFVGAAPGAGHCLGASIELISVAQGVPLHDGVEAEVAALRRDTEAKMQRVVGLCSVPLDAREASVRTRETNIGNMIADLMRRCVRADVAMLNGGTIRANALIQPGPLRARDLVALLPFYADVVVRVRVRGAVLRAALENSVSKWPATDGRFCQVSGVRFSFDPREPPGARVVEGSVHVLVKRPRSRGSLLRGAVSPRAPAPRAPSPTVAPSDAFFFGGGGSGGDNGGDTSGSESEGDGGRLRDTGSVPVEYGPFSSLSRDSPATAGSAPGSLVSVPPRFAASSGEPPAAPPPPRLSILRPAAFPPPPWALLPDGDALGAQSPSTVGLATAIFRLGEEAVDAAAAVPPLTLAELSGGCPAPPQLGALESASPRKHWAPLEPGATYTVAIKAFLLAGKDGYAMFEAREGSDTVVEIPEEGGHCLPALLSSHLEVLQQWDGGSAVAASAAAGPPPPSPAQQATQLEVPERGSPRSAYAAAGGGDVCLSRSAVAPRAATIARVPSQLFPSFAGGEDSGGGGGGGGASGVLAAAAAVEQPGAAALPRSRFEPLPGVQYSLAIAPKVDGRITRVDGDEPTTADYPC